MRTIVFKDAQGDWQWHIIAKNSKVVAKASEGFKTKRSVLANLRLISSVRTVKLMDPQSIRPIIVTL